MAIILTTPLGGSGASPVTGDNKAKIAVPASITNNENEVIVDSVSTALVTSVKWFVTVKSATTDHILTFEMVANVRGNTPACAEAFIVGDVDTLPYTAKAVVSGTNLQLLLINDSTEAGAPVDYEIDVIRFDLNKV